MFYDGDRHFLNDSVAWQKWWNLDLTCDRILRMEFHTFVQTLMWIPVQVLQTGRRLVYRVLAWRPDLPILFRLDEALDTG